MSAGTWPVRRRAARSGKARYHHWRSLRTGPSSRYNIYMSVAASACRTAMDCTGHSPRRYRRTSAVMHAVSKAMAGLWRLARRTTCRSARISLLQRTAAGSEFWLLPFNLCLLSHDRRTRRRVRDRLVGQADALPGCASAAACPRFSQHRGLVSRWNDRVKASPRSSGEAFPRACLGAAGSARRRAVSGPSGTSWPAVGADLI